MALGFPGLSLGLRPRSFQHFPKLATALCWAVTLPLAWSQPLLQLNQVAADITLPTDIQNAGDGSGRLFLVQQNGLIKILVSGQVLATPFLDIRAKVFAGGERGLLGLAFSPGFAQNGRFYVHYSNLQGNTVLSGFQVMTADPNRANPGSEQILLSAVQPFSNHNGGQIGFGPDGYLYMALGDGGAGGDPQNNALQLNTLLGKILRLDVESQPGTLRIPPDNPFVGTAGARGEIWAYGLRNPWRFSFDRDTGDLWIADVGQDRWEEINYQPALGSGANVAGRNYGWRTFEANTCYRLADCSGQSPDAFPQLTFPVHAYGRSQSACSITGGYVYRGASSPSLRGTFLFGDYCNGIISGLRRTGNTWTAQQLIDTNLLLTTFGQDEAGELYAADAATGRIYRLIGPSGLQLESTNIVNAASFASGALAPGSLATAFIAGLRDTNGIAAASAVPLPLELDGVSVRVNGVPAPVLAVARVNGVEQVNFQIPWSVAGPSMTIVVRRGSEESNAVQVPVAALAPGVFQLNATDPLLVRSSDYTLVSPGTLLPGDDVFLYATGLGAVTNPVATGAAAPIPPPLSEATANVRVLINGMEAEVQFAGLAPGFPGVFQVNFRVPGGIGTGPVIIQLLAN